MPIRPQTRTAAQLKPQTLMTLGFSNTEAAVIVAIAAQVPGIATAISLQLGDVSVSAQIGTAVPAAETRAAIASIISGALGASVPAIASAAAAAVQLQGQVAAAVPGISSAAQISGETQRAAQIALGVPAVAASVAAAAIAQGQINAAAPGVASSLAAAAIAQAQVAAQVPAVASAVAAQIGSASAATQIQSAVPAIANAIAAAVVAQAQAAVAAPGVASAIAATVTIAAQMGAAVPGIASNVAGAIASSYGPLTLDYQSRVTAAGGTLSTAALNLVDAFFYTAYNNGSGGSGRVADFSSSFPFLWLPVSDFAGILVPLLGASFTNTGFVSGDWNIQIGLLGGVGKFLNSGVSGSVVAQDSAAIGAWIPNIPGGTTAFIVVGARNAGSTAILDTGNNTTTTSVRARVNRSTSTAAVRSNTLRTGGFLLGRRVVSTQYEIWTIDTSGVLGSTVIASTSGPPPAESIYVGALNAGGTAAAEYQERIGAAFLCSAAPSIAQVNILYNALAAAAASRSTL